MIRGNLANMPTTKEQTTKEQTVGVRIAIPRGLHTVLSDAAKQDERKLAVYIVRLLRRYISVGEGIATPQFRRPVTVAEAAAAQRQPVVDTAAFFHPDPVPEGISTAPGGPVGDAWPHEATPEKPIQEWPDDQLLKTLIEKRAFIQAEKSEITNTPAPDAESRKAVVEQVIQFVGVLEREVMRRRGKIPRKAPQPPRENPQPRTA